MRSLFVRFGVLVSIPRWISAGCVTEKRVCASGRTHRGLMPQHEVEAALVSAQHPIEAAFGELMEAAVFRLLLAAQETRSHHRRQR
jgi:hypothetical protein